MPPIAEQLSAQFFRWELRGRGWQVMEEPIDIEPPYRPFIGHFLTRQRVADDGRKHSATRGLMERLHNALSPKEEEPEVDEEEQSPVAFERGEIVELQVTL